MSTVVRCVVEECVYHKEHMCRADKIEIRSNENGNDIVGTPAGTMCGTFRYRDFDDGAVTYKPEQPRW